VGALAGGMGDQSGETAAIIVLAPAFERLRPGLQGGPTPWCVGYSSWVLASRCDLHQSLGTNSPTLTLKAPTHKKCLRTLQTRAPGPALVRGVTLSWGISSPPSLRYQYIDRNERSYCLVSVESAEFFLRGQPPSSDGVGHAALWGVLVDFCAPCRRSPGRQTVAHMTETWT
jgi:hypothetical protein